jgi:RNA polymerase sigma-70 factor (sigma-E family)
MPSVETATAGTGVTSLPVDAGGYAVRQDETAAFDAFVRARMPELRRFGRVLTGCDEAAADLVQDALERTLLHWSRIQTRDNPEGYVRRIMVNRNISLWRRHRREHLTDELPESGHEDRHGDTELWRALQALPPRQRTVIALRYYEDLTESEVAAAMGCSIGTVKSQASKAIHKLRLHAASFSDRPASTGAQSGGAP